MIASDKVKLIKAIANALYNEEYGIIDLTLNQFKFQTSDYYGGEKLNYIIQQIQDGEEKNLIDLAAHLNVEIVSKVLEIKPSFWEDGYFRLFLSHLATDKKNAKELKEKLDKYSISAFVAHSDIEPTKPWQDEIELALSTCDSLVALMIDGFHDSKWTDQEIGFAMGRDLLIIPIRMGHDPYGFIGKYQAISYSDLSTLANDIFESLIKNKKTSKKISYSMLYKFKRSNSYSESKQLIEYVEKLDYWDKILINMLKAANDDNSQIYDSFGVSSRISSLLNKLKIK